MSEARNPLGSGNPPGKNSKGYLNSTGDSGHFVERASYAGSMDVGRSPKNPPVVGNQPKQSSTASLGMRTKAI